MGAIRDRRLRAVIDQNMFDVVDDCNIELDRIKAMFEQAEDHAPVGTTDCVHCRTRAIGALRDVLGVVSRLRAGNDDDGLSEVWLLIARIRDMRALHRVGAW